MTNNNYLVSLPIPAVQASFIEKTQHEISWHTEIPPPCKKLVPHVTAFRPIGLASTDEQRLVSIVEKIASRLSSFSVAVGPMDSFGKNLAVRRLPLNKELALLQSLLIQELPSLPGFEFELYDKENTYHITYAEKLYKVFDEVWEKIKNIPLEALTIPFNSMELFCKKPGEKYERIAIFPFGI